MIFLFSFKKAQRFLVQNNYRPNPGIMNVLTQAFFNTWIKDYGEKKDYDFTSVMKLLIQFVFAF